MLFPLHSTSEAMKLQKRHRPRVENKSNGLRLIQSGFMVVRNSEVYLDWPVCTESQNFISTSGDDCQKWNRRLVREETFIDSQLIWLFTDIRRRQFSKDTFNPLYLPIDCTHYALLVKMRTICSAVSQSLEGHFLFESRFCKAAN